MQWFSVVSNSANAVSGLSNIKLFEGSTLLGSAQNLLAFPSVPGGTSCSRISPLIIQNGTSVTLTIMRISLLPRAVRLIWESAEEQVLP